jgi:hypothetical protein
MSLKSLKVKDEYRQNELSLSPGGSEVTTILSNGKKLTYDKIKAVDKYCKRLKNDPLVSEILVDGVEYWKRNQ